MTMIGNLVLKEHASVPFLANPAWLDCPYLVHGFSTRQGGMSKGDFASLNVGTHVGDDIALVEENRRLWANALGASTFGQIFMEQVHSATVRIVNEPGAAPACDGVVTQKPGLLLNVLVADCMPILMFDSVTHTVAAVHGGWRGTAAGIAARAVRLMEEQLGVNPANLEAVIGPGIGGCCYRVDEPVIDAVSKLDVELAGVVADCTEPGQWLLDLPALNSALLTSVGVPRTNILLSGLCTLERSDYFYSYRRDAEKTGRLVGSIGLLP